MKTLVETLNESLMSDIKNKCKESAKKWFSNIRKKMIGLKNPCLLITVGLDGNFTRSADHAVFGVKSVTDKLNSYIKKNVPSVEELYYGPDRDCHLYELVNISHDDAVDLYNTIKDMFIDGMKKEGITEILDKDRILGDGLSKFDVLETDAVLHLEQDGKRHYIYPCIRLDYVK